MKRNYFLGISAMLMLCAFSFTSKAEIDFDLTTVGGSITLGYDDVAAEKDKAASERWISVVNFGNSGTASRCEGVSKTFDIKGGRFIHFFLAKCDKIVINANIATGRGLRVYIDDALTSTLDGTGLCEVYEVEINKEVPVKVSVDGLNSNSAWTSLFSFYYAAKVPSIESFKVNGYEAVIDQENKTIQLELPYGEDISNTTPEVTIGGIATSYTPTTAQNFTSGAVVYTATDGTTSVDYTATITVKAVPDTNKSITSLSVNGKAAVIDEVSGAISVEFASFEGPLSTWPVEFELDAVTASADFVSGNSYDFATNPTLSIVVTAQDNSTKTYQVTPIISTKKNIAMLTATGAADASDGILLSALSDYYVSFLTAEATAPASIADFYQNYDLIMLHSSVGGTNATGLASKEMVGVKPILNLKAYFYTNARWSWGAPANAPAGSYSAEVEVSLQNHPIFDNVTFEGTTLSFYDNLPVTNINAIQYASSLSTLPEEFSSNTIAAVKDISGSIQMHEIQNNIAAKYLLIGLSFENSNYSYFNQNTVNILKNSVAYLLDPTVKYSYGSTSVNDLKVNKGLSIEKNVILNPSKMMLSIYNASGVRVSVSNDEIISTTMLPNGIYIVKGENASLKFVK